MSEKTDKLKRWDGAPGAHIAGIAHEIGDSGPATGEIFEVSHIIAYFCSTKCRDTRAPKRIET